MTVENPIQYQVELVNRLWSQGWSAFRTASSGPGAVAECDVIACKDGEFIFLNVVLLKSGTSSKKVGERNDDLIKIKRRADASGFGDESSVVIGHAIRYIQDNEWYYTDISDSKVRASKDYKSLNQVTL